VFVIALLQTLLQMSGPASAVCDGRPVLGSDENGVECDSYCRLLLEAAHLSAVNAESPATSTYRDLYANPERLRGRVVAISATLKRVTVYAAPDCVRARTGIKMLYEAWLALQPTGEPLCIVISNWPAGIPHSGPLDIPVSAAGYFFKRYRYEAPDGWRDAPLLIGGKISPRAVADFAPLPGIRAALPCAAAVIALAIMRFWLWSDDRSFRRLSQGVKMRG
jgi:hypothetical protein